MGHAPPVRRGGGGRLGRARRRLRHAAAARPRTLRAEDLGPLYRFGDFFRLEAATASLVLLGFLAAFVVVVGVRLRRLTR